MIAFKAELPFALIGPEIIMELSILWHCKAMAYALG